MYQRRITGFCFALVVLLLGACATERMNREAANLLAEGRYEEGFAMLEEVAKENPQDFRLRSNLIRQREVAMNRLLAGASADRAGGRPDEAEATYNRILKMDAGNERAHAGLDILVRDRRHNAMLEQAQALYKKGDIERTRILLTSIKLENPQNSDMLALQHRIDEGQAKQAMPSQSLSGLYRKPVSLEFRDANVKMIFEALSRTTGINFILDRDVRSDMRATLFLKQSTLEDGVNLLLATSQLEKKILSQNSVLIYPNTPAKLKEYQDLMVKSFYLGNADVKQTASMVKMLLKTRDIYVDEKLNMLVMRDSPEAIQLAERMIAMQDLAEPEVMLEVEVLEIKRTKLLELGIQWPNQLTLAPIASSGTTVTLTDLKNINSDHISGSLSNTIINLTKQDGNVNLLANPRIRVRNREKARILIGDKVPVITTTSTSTGFVAESVSYLDVGLKLEVEPNVYLQDEVAIKVGLEVSSIANQVKSAGGTLTYQIGTRNANTVLRLKDGETQVLAGLINDEDRSSANKVPGLGDLPMVGRLFGSQRDDRQKTEIVLSITPHLIRNIKRPDASAEMFWSGTEDKLRMSPLTAQIMATPDEQEPLTNQAALKKMDSVDSNVATKPAAGGDALLPSSVGLSWDAPAVVKVGEKFKVALRVKTNSELRSLPLQIGYDPAVFQMVEVAEGGFFKQGGNPTSFTSRIDAVSGKVFIGMTRSGGNGAKGEDTIVNLTLKPVVGNPASEIKILSVSAIGATGVSPSVVLPLSLAVSTTP